MTLPAAVDGIDSGNDAALVVAVAPFGRASARSVAAAAQAGGLGVLDLTAGDRMALDELDTLTEWALPAFGVRLGVLDRVTHSTLPAAAHTVILAHGSNAAAADFPGRRVLAEVRTRRDATLAVAAGAHGLIARGHESGGRVGELSTFVLLQALLADPAIVVPVWITGAGPHTAGGAVAGGAAGVVLDVQLALLDEVGLPAGTAAALAGLDGSESTVVDGVRTVKRPGAAEPIAIGQDGFLATTFQQRWGTVAAAVRGVRDAVLDGLRATGRSAGPEHEGGTAFGTRLPVAQGPMTRVSDQAAFAAAVAGEGALPFIALALSGREQTRQVLEQTQHSIGDAPWGVGVLGFAADDVKSAQLEVIRELRPSHAIIAGGRPAQAAALEEVGISTFLHVPSPGLLKQFLQAGSRKFIFEGAECGGHVGPRGSFPLWEAQLQILHDFLAIAPASTARELQVYFAGGVHDARSAAMVMAMAASLSERGAAIGMLMGTAYLFTAEAVDAGAVLPLFQRQVVAAEATDLLETAPGHATRCVRSPFTEEYATIKSDLATAGVPKREAWEQLEQLNVGRLRLASKGIERVGDELREVGEDRQLAEGMFMAGEVAVLRSAVTTIADLHESVSTGARELLEQRVTALLGTPEEAAPEPLDIAIVGMACMFAEAPDLASFWANVLAGTDAVTEVPAQRWDQSIYYDVDGQGERTPSRWGGFLPEIPFDPLSYGIPPASLASIEPVQLLALEAAQRALTDAGYRDRKFDRARTSVVFGAEAGSDLSGAMTLRTVLPSYLGEIPPALDALLPQITGDSFPGVLANVISGRIANRLDLGGANYTVDAACASSLTAVDVACKELVSGTSDIVLCGGADLHNGINDYLLFASAHALSPTGRSATFDSAADGIALGEGVACVVLKRLADAERDGDRVYAVIKGVGSASDGRALGLTAPRPEGQHNALTRAYRNAGVSPADVGLVEAHGTGTAVGDRIELTTLTKVFTEAGAEPGQCTVGSVKSQIGHTKCAAGLAGLVKTSLALYTGVKPPTLHVAKPNAAWDADTSPFVFHAEPSPWPAPASERLAGVSAFGFGGTNFHVVLGAHDGGAPPAHTLDEWPAELFSFAGTDQAAAVKAAEDLLALATEVPASERPWRLRDLALSASRRAELATARGASVRLAIVASTVDELIELLPRAAAGDHEPDAGIFLRDETAVGDVAVLFPGQGSQKPRMLAELFVAFPELKRYLRLDPEVGEVIFPPAAFDEAARQAQLTRLTDTRVAQPALGIAGLAAFDLLTRAGVRPSMVAGHSYGELAALSAAGVLSPRSLVECSHARAAAILASTGEGDPGAMAATTAPVAEIEKVLAAAGLTGTVVLANRNSPAQTVLSGPTEAVDDAVARLRAGGLGAKRIQVACAFHSPLVAGAGRIFGASLAEVPIGTPELPVWSNRTAGRYPAEPEAIREELAAQIGAPVQFSAQIEAMYAAGARVFVEAGPGTVLTKLVTAILGDRPHRVVPLETGKRKGISGFLHALAHLAVTGTEVRSDWLFRNRDAVDAGQSTRPKRAGWTVDGHLLRTADGAIPAHALKPAERIQETLVPTVQSAGSDALIADFLRTSREMIAAQRDVLLGHLGAAPAPLSYVTAERAVIEHRPEPVRVIQESPAAPVAVASVTPVLETVLAVIAERTGYPVDMIEPELDLEADLSVDSIKRAEIAGELATRLGLTVDAGTDVEALAKARTAGQLAELLGAQVTTAQVTTAPAAAAAEPAAATVVPVLETVLAVIAERTGYPVEMIEPELDLEADLSVDSIKRAEIAGELATRLGLSAADGADVEVLAKARTVAAIAELLTGSSAPQAAPVEAVPAEPEPGTSALVVAPRRLVLTEYDLPESTVDTIAGKRFLVLGSSPAAALLRDGLATHGAEVVLATEVPAGRFDGVIHLPERDPDPVLPDMFPVYQQVLATGPRWLLTAGPADGLRGFYRSVSREYPETVARVVEHARDASAECLAAGLLAELSTLDREPVVLRTADSRRGIRMTEQSLGLLGSTGAGPAGDGAAEIEAMGLDRDSVVLLVGGAKGITARFATTLAEASRCRLELLGRTAAPAVAEDPAFAGASTAVELRAALIASGLRVPAEIERTVGRLLGEREVRGTLRRLAEAGSEVRYHSTNMLDAEAVHRAVKEIYAEHGRLDGVVYAAGVIEDRLIAEKSAASFNRVYSTKVDGAQALLDAVGGLPVPPRFAVLFGSIAATLGNRGQSDYAAANDALESLGRRWTAAVPGRALTVHWGPWAPTGTNDGMVTPELMRDYGRRGIKLIDPEEGTMSLLRELAWGPEDASAVVYTASGW